MAGNLLCRVSGHKFIKTAENKLYYVETCVRCNLTRRTYFNPADAAPRKVRLQKRVQ